MMTMNARTGVTRKIHQPRETQDTLLRRELGDVLRLYRQRQGRTLREVSSDARVSLGYLSEVERGQKEASSELLSSICNALNVPMSHVLRIVANRIDAAEGRTPVNVTGTLTELDAEVFAASLSDAALDAMLAEELATLAAK